MRSGVTWATITSVMLVIVVLQRRLPPETFFAGDSGVKLIAVKNVLAHPSRPLEISIPAVDGHRLPYVEPFFMIHGDHSHASTTELFPILTAPFAAAFGVRGLYVLPALGGAATLLAWSCIGIMLDRRRHAAFLVTVLALSSPLVFYSLEFWEHAPAFGVESIGLSLLLASQCRAGHKARTMRVCAGVCFGVSFLLRPEAVLFAVASLASVMIAVPSLRTATCAAEVTVGSIVAALPLAVYDLNHFGALIDPHLSANANLLFSKAWLASRLQIAKVWLIEGSRANVVLVAPTIVLAALQLFERFRRKGTQLLVLLSCGYLLLTLLTSPNDGGAQWGPRYLLCIYGPVSILVADSLQTLPTAAAIRISVLIAALLMCVWVQRISYKSLRTTKLIYGQVLRFVKDTAPANGWIVTDLWWLDQVAADATPERRFLFATSAAELAEISARLQAAGVKEVTLMSSSTESPTALGKATTPGCREVKRRTIPERNLMAVSLFCGV